MKLRHYRGTLFLDEIGDMPLELQAVLLRLLDDWQVRPLAASERGGRTCCWWPATNADLEDRIAAGTFRADLFYRLNVEVRLPGLADRSDFRAIANRLLQNWRRARASRPTRWHGLRRIGGPATYANYAMCLPALKRPEGTIELAATARLLGPAGAAAASEAGAVSQQSTLRGSVRARGFSRLTNREGRNVSRAARRLGVSRNTVYRAINAG